MTMTTKNTESQDGGAVSSLSSSDMLALIKDAKRYRAIREKIEYEGSEDGMQWANLNWCVDVYSLAPSSLDEAIDEILLS